MRTALLVAVLGIAAPAMAEDAAAPLNPGNGWQCTESFPGGPRVCGSTHSTDQPPRIITREVPIEQPVPVPADEQPAIVVTPAPVFVRRPHREPPRPYPYRRQLLPNHF